MNKKYIIFLKIVIKYKILKVEYVHKRNF